MGFFPRGFGELIMLINKGAVWMYNTFTVIATKLGCTNGMTMKCCNKTKYKLLSKVGSVLNAMINGTSVIWNAEWNGYLNGSLQ